MESHRQWTKNKMVPIMNSTSIPSSMSMAIDEYQPGGGGGGGGGSSKTALSKINLMQYNGILTDFQIICQDEVFYCHKLIMASASTYLRNLFQKPVGSTGMFTVLMNSVTPDDIRNIIKFIYEGQVVFRKSESTNFLEAARLLHLDEVHSVKTIPTPMKKVQHHRDEQRGRRAADMRIIPSFVKVADRIGASFNESAINPTINVTSTSIMSSTINSITMACHESVQTSGLKKRSRLIESPTEHRDSSLVSFMSSSMIAGQAKASGSAPVLLQQPIKKETTSTAGMNFKPMKFEEKPTLKLDPLPGALSENNSRSHSSSSKHLRRVVQLIEEAEQENKTEIVHPRLLRGGKPILQEIRPVVASHDKPLSGKIVSTTMNVQPNLPTISEAEKKLIRKVVKSRKDSPPTWLGEPGSMFPPPSPCSTSTAATTTTVARKPLARIQPTKNKNDTSCSTLDTSELKRTLKDHVIAFPKRSEKPEQISLAFKASSGNHSGPNGPSKKKRQHELKELHAFQSAFKDGGTEMNRDLDKSRIVTRRHFLKELEVKKQGSEGEKKSVTMGPPPPPPPPPPQGASSSGSRSAVSSSSRKYRT